MTPLFYANPSGLTLCLCKGDQFCHKNDSLPEMCLKSTIHYPLSKGKFEIINNFPLAI